MVELEGIPDQLRMATKNNFGLEVSNILDGLGFVSIEDETEGTLVLMNTPKKLLGKDWSLSRPESTECEKQDPNIFTIYLKHEGELGYMEFLRQVATKQGDYCIFFP